MKQQIGVALGTVTDLKDPQGEGRIKIKFTSFLEGGPESTWAAIAAPMAGSGRGVFFMPEKGDEVLVAFDRGHFDHPYVVGFLWNGVDRPPETDPKNRVILTPGGHTLRFEDGDNSKKIVIKSSGGHKIVLDDTASGQTITLMTNGNQSVVLDDKDSSIQLQGGGRILAMRAGQVQIS